MLKPFRRFAGPALVLAAPILAALAPSVQSGVGPAARAASFDCAKAATPTEHAICNSPELSALDGRLGAVYDQRVALDPGLRQIQRGWLAARNTGCGADRVCLANFMNAELAWFASGVSRPTDRLPVNPGVCGLSNISDVGTRLEGTPGSGSAVSEGDGADQVSYDTVAAIDRSRRGDPVLVCLVSLPTNCPAGDDRGKIYAVANLRTLGAWSAPDSEHSCGGA
jgi:uncharacterized protein